MVIKMNFCGYKKLYYGRETFIEPFYEFAKLRNKW